MANLPNLWLAVIALDVFIMFVAWLICCVNRRAGLVDVVWSFGICVNILLVAQLSAQAPLSLRLFLAIASGLWFARLGWHLLRRYLAEHEEDTRYAAMRAAMGRGQHVGFFLFFMFQAGLVLLFSAPMLLLLTQPSNLWSDYLPLYLFIAAFIMLVAFVGEWLADHQLYQFKQNSSNRGKTLDTGLWRYSRHPNYFFEWLHWFAYPILGLAVGLYSLWIYPILMFLFLYYITGIPFSEQQALRNRGQNYLDYQNRTPIFFPWKPKQ